MNDDQNIIDDGEEIIVLIDDDAPLEDAPVDETIDASLEPGATLEFDAQVFAEDEPATVEEVVVEETIAIDEPVVIEESVVIEDPVVIEEPVIRECDTEEFVVEGPEMVEGATVVLPEVAPYVEEPRININNLEYDENDESGSSGNILNKAMAFFGVALAVVAIIFGISYYEKNKYVPEPVDFNDVGTTVASLGLIGEDKIVAITSVQEERIDELNLAIDQLGYDEIDDAEDVVHVGITLTTILKDLKIKFVNGKDKLIANVPFQVEVTDAKGNTVIWTDTDKDGIIYQDGLAGGKYSIKLVALNGFDSFYDFGDGSKQSVTVKTQLDYKKVDVSNEVKSASQVNAATEDTASKDTEEESKLKDTVAYVMSAKTQTSNGYEPIDKSKITDPMEAIAKLNEVAAFRFARLSGIIVNTDDVSDNDDGGEEPPAHEHDFSGDYKTLSDGTHQRKCTGCDEYGPAEACTYATEFVSTTPGFHHHVCTLCGGASTDENCTYKYIVSNGKHCQECEICKARTAVEDCIDENPKDGHCDKCGDILASEATISFSKNSDPKIAVLSMTDKESTAAREKTYIITATLMVNGSPVSEGLKYSWSVKNGDSIVPENETLNTNVFSYNAVKKGSTTVECDITMSNNAHVKSSYQIDVAEQRITFDITTKKVIFVGDENKYFVIPQATYSDGDQKTLDNRQFSWTSSDPSVATVSDMGLVTAVKPGTVTITATYKDTGANIEAVAQKQMTVIVYAHPKNDTVTKLLDKDGKQVYKYDSSSKKYVEATYADYYSGVTLYSSGAAGYLYTGWWTLDGKTYYFDANGKKVTGEQVILGAKYNFGSDGVLKSGTGTFGIDVSSWNGNIDWTKVAKSGVNYAIIRCGFRGSTAGGLVEDSKFAQNIKNATAAGIKVGVYFFTQAVSEAEAVEEASMVLGLIKDYKLKYPVFIDVENATNGRANNLSKDTRTAIVKAFCKTITGAGYKAGVYANRTWLTNKLNASELNEYAIWLAQYVSSPTYTSRYDVWQYSSTGAISGITGEVDLNLSYLGY